MTDANEMTPAELRAYPLRLAWVRAKMGEG
jgi:hypothetical protein